MKHFFFPRPLLAAGVLGLLAPGAAFAAPPTAPAPWVAADPSALRVSAVADPAGWTEVGLAISPASGVQRLLLRKPLALKPNCEVLFYAALSSANAPGGECRQCGNATSPNVANGQYRRWTIRKHPYVPRKRWTARGGGSTL